MSAPMISQEMIDRTVAFHRSLCPGLALGMKAAQVALYELGQDDEAVSYHSTGGVSGSSPRMFSPPAKAYLITRGPMPVVTTT